MDSGLSSAGNAVDSMRRFANSRGEDSPRVAIILLNWNSKDDTLECLESVFRLEYPNYCVVLCDNDSNDGTLEAVEDWADGKKLVTPASHVFDKMFAQPRPRRELRWRRLSRKAADRIMVMEREAELILIDTGANLGFAGGNNVGIRYAIRNLEPDYLWLLNTDTVVEAGSLAALVSRAESDHSVGMVGSSVIYYWKPDVVQALGGAVVDPRTVWIEHIGDGSHVTDIPKTGDDVEAQMAYVLGASMLVSRRFVERVGLLCEDYFLYYEEFDWVMRAKKHFFTMGFAPTSYVFHKVGGASRRIASLTSQRYMWRNRIRFVARFLPDRLPWTLASMVLEMLRAGMRGRISTCLAIAGALLDCRRLAAAGREIPGAEHEQYVE